jgi:hypothetical protein
VAEKMIWKPERPVSFWLTSMLWICWTIEAGAGQAATRPSHNWTVTPGSTER